MIERDFGARAMVLRIRVQILAHLKVSVVRKALDGCCFMRNNML